jgi:hypothetical protein
MPDMSTIAAALSSFNVLKNIAQSMIALRDSQALQAKIIEFNEALIDAQTKIFSVNEERSTLIERVRDLEKQVIQLETWDAEKKRYELKAFARGAFAYALKPEAQGTEPPHQICANCYARGKKSILQLVPSNTARTVLGMGTTYRCPECKSEIRV